MRLLRLVGLAACAAEILVSGPIALAEPITLNGITFSDEAGGFVLIDGWGSGTRGDPFVIVERIFGDEPAVLVVRDLTAAFGNPVGTQHIAGFAMTKVVINGTERTWRSYELELQERLGQDSTYGDGLSFGQHARARRSFSSDLYRDMTAIDEPLDGVTFSQGAVRPGEQVVFSFFVTDNTPKSVFYLVQRREAPVATIPRRTERRPSSG